ncbi:MAG: hypothetical protein B6241_09640 [Spirochaetaceae bacterium 4572_59]|nr:MAG: hypothetical protein B6241_09640 [Spirochaetaceae bacterium 4572_59]
MAKIYLDEQFKFYLLSSYPIDESLLDHLLEDMGEYFSKDVRDFISLRHQELHREGMKNDQIYGQIQKELKERRFAGPDMSIRQIRRAIYG